MTLAAPPRAVPKRGRGEENGDNTAAQGGGGTVDKARGRPLKWGRTPSRRCLLRSTGTPSRRSTSSSRSFPDEGSKASSSSSARTLRMAGRCRAVSWITGKRSKKPPSARPVRRPASRSSSSASSVPTPTRRATRASIPSRRSSWPGRRAPRGAGTTPRPLSSPIPWTGGALSPSTTAASSTIISPRRKGSANA
jgi:hypothetical protein